VNMAPASVLECLSQLLESEGSITLYASTRPGTTRASPGPRISGCLPAWTLPELYCDEMADQADITMLVTD
jgi:hypothetical protein